MGVLVSVLEEAVVCADVDQRLVHYPVLLQLVEDEAEVLVAPEPALVVLLAVLAVEVAGLVGLGGVEEGYEVLLMVVVDELQELFACTARLVIEVLVHGGHVVHALHVGEHGGDVAGLA